MAFAVPRRWRIAAASIGLAAIGPAPALAHDELISADGAIKPGYLERALHQHGDSAGHLPASRTDNVELVSTLALKNVDEGKIADVGLSPDGNTAYLAAWGGQTCKYNGVHVVDMADPAAPREVAFIPSKEGSYAGEGVQSIDLTTSAFRGRILVTNNEICKGRTGFGGVNIYNVTDPRQPTPLAVGIGDENVSGQGKKAAHQIHSVFAWDAGDRAYAVIVDNEEGKDVDILDITNPKVPQLVAEYDLDERFPSIAQAAPSNLKEIFLHDMVVKEIGGRQIMLLSYWDAGYVQLDVTDVRDPTLVSDTDFADPDPEALESGFTVPPEGNGHQAEFTDDNRYVIAADEDFAPYALVARNVTDGTDVTASQGSDTRRLPEGEQITGVARFAGRACATDPAPPAGDGTQIAVVERGVCTFTEKVGRVIAAGGYAAVLVINREGSDGCSDLLGMSVEGDIPAFGVAPRDQGYAIFGKEALYDETACRAGDGTALSPMTLGELGDTLTFGSYFDGWGYVHLYGTTPDENGKLPELDTYAIPEAHQTGKATGFGDLSVHEVATSREDSDRAYFSYYSGGLRVTEIENDRLVEKGHFIDEGGSNLWGVEVFDHAGDEYVAASDRDKGLYVFRYTGG